VRSENNVARSRVARFVRFLRGLGESEAGPRQDAATPRPSAGAQPNRVTGFTAVPNLRRASQHCSLSVLGHYPGDGNVIHNRLSLRESLLYRESLVCQANWATRRRVAAAEQWQRNETGCGQDGMEYAAPSNPIVVPSNRTAMQETLSSLNAGRIERREPCEGILLVDCCDARAVAVAVARKWAAGAVTVEVAHVGLEGSRQ